MLIPGLVSVTFRKLSRSEVADVLKNAGLSAIEWGGDVHVPPNNAHAAEDAAMICSAQGIKCVSYGSYFRCTPDENEINAAVETSLALRVPNIRVWAGSRGSADSDKEYRAEVVSNLKKICRCAAKHKMTVSPEFHGGTLTDHYESALRLIDEVAESNFKLYWQPDQHRDDSYNIAALKAVLPYLSNVHVFSWSAHEHFPLAHGETMWRKYIELLSEDAHDHHMLLEFVCDDTPAQFYRDAEVLLRWLEK